MSAIPAAVRVCGALLDTFRNHVARFVPPVADRLESCWELCAEGQRLSKVEIPDFRHETADVILWGTALRGLKTYRAVLYLCSLGYGPQAMMLNRSLIEDTLTARWAELHREEAMERIARHERHNLYLWVETLKNRELDLGALADLAPLSEAEVGSARDDFGRYGERPWTGHRNIVNLFEDLAADWGDDNERDLLGHVRSIYLRYANLTVHNTASSISKPSFPDDTTISYSAAESEDDVAGALLLAFWAFGQLFRVMLRGEQRDDFETFYAKRMPTFFQP